METRLAPDQWDEAVADTDGPQLIVAGPGAGKTEFLVRRAAHLLGRNRDQILLLTFSRRGAVELSERLHKHLGHSHGDVGARTFHAFAWNVLEAYAPDSFGWEEMPALLTGPEQVAFVAGLLHSEDATLWPLAFRGMLASRTFATEVTDFLLRAAEHLTTVDDLDAAARSRDDWRALPGFLVRYRAALAAAGRIDYGTVQAAAVELLADATVAADVSRSFSHVLCDEYQDTTHAQARLLEQLFDGTGNLVVAGDPYQSIYSFRGAQLSNIAEYPERFRSDDGRRARRFVLTHSFRVPARILESAVALTSGQELPGAAGPVTPARGTGVVAAFRFDQQTEEAEWIAAEADRLHAVEGIPYSAMAVLVRTKRRLLLELSRALDRRRIPHDRPDARLADQPVVRTITALVGAACGRDVDASLRIVLLGPWFRLPWGRVRELEQRRAEGTPWPEVLAAGLPALAALLDDSSWAVGPPAVRGLWHLWERIPEASHIANSSDRSADRRALASLFQAAERLTERDPRATLADYVTVLEDEEFEATPLLSYTGRDRSRLTLTTLHQAKGIEFDVVFIADAVEGVFPDLRRRDSLLGARDLSPSMPTDHTGRMRFALQEETRLAYTAMTRARRLVVWTATAAGFDEGTGVPSRFIGRVAAEIGTDLRPPPPHTAPTGPRDAESMLRRLVADPEAGKGRRLAAAALLAAGRRFGVRPIDTFAGVRPRGGGSQKPPPPRGMSPTAADAYLTCPRAYFLERRVARLDDSVYLSFGSDLHKILEQAERAAGPPPRTAAPAIALVPEYITDDRYGGPRLAPWWRRRAEDALEHLYANWPGPPARALALELEIATEHAGVEWRGRIDRLEELDDGTLRVVDYKTSKTALRKADAAASLQLGFYVEAVNRDPQWGRVSAAELWYPAADSKSLTRRAYDMAQRDAVLARMGEAVRGIAECSWPATPTAQCDRCAVRSSCPAWPEGREAHVA